MKWTILFSLVLIVTYCKSPVVKKETPVEKIELQPEVKDSTTEIKENKDEVKDITKNKYLDQNYPKEKLLKGQTDSNIVAKAKALISEANILSKLQKNEEALVKYEEAFEFGTDPEAYYRYGNALSNLQKLDESIQAYDIALELGYEKDYYALYNKACSYSLLKNAEESFKFIILAVDKGYKAISYMKDDPDLEYIRSLPEWKSKYKEIKKHARERAELENNKG